MSIHLATITICSVSLSFLFLVPSCNGVEGMPIEQRTTGGPPQDTLLLHEPGVENAYPRLSADGKRILYQSNRTGKWQLYIMDIATGTQQPITDDAHNNNNFVDWSADNAWIAFVSDRDGNEEIYRMRTDGSGLERLTDHPARDIHPYFSPDGKYLLFNSTRANGSLDIFRLDLTTKELMHLTSSMQEETCARYSPDMKHIVFLRNDAASDDVAVLDLSTGLTENLTRTPQVIDGWPMYSPDGTWIYYSTMASGQHSIHRVHPDGTGDETITQAAPGEEDGRWRIRADLNRTDPSFQRRLVAIEDKRFWLHPGVDPAAIVRAAGSAVLHGRVSSGASTLSMQTARLLEPRPRTIPAKLIEMARAAHDTWERLGQISAPTLVAGGRYDGVALPQTLERMAARIPGARLEFFEGGHLFMIQDRAAVKAMIAFLQDA